jgi:hypothetical protein
VIMWRYASDGKVPIPAPALACIPASAFLTFLIPANAPNFRHPDELL